MKLGGAVDDTSVGDEFLHALRNGKTFVGKWTDVVEQIDPWKDFMEALVANEHGVTITIDPLINQIRLD